MHLYYQTVENPDHGGGSWKSVVTTYADQIRREQAYHMTIYALDRDPGDDTDAVSYKGDLWFDIDHKPVNDSEQAKHESIKRAIHDVQRLESYLTSLGMDTKYCRWFASGSKGFHACIPGALFGGTKMMKGLPRIHKQMAVTIEQESGMEGMDKSLYNMGMGKMLRVENKQRSNGKYKVPVTVDEIKVMTPEMYLKLVSSPRPETINTPIERCQPLAMLFMEAASEQHGLAKTKITAIGTDKLQVFGDDNHPVCVQWLTGNMNIKQRDGQFNTAKMSLARYLMTAPLSEGERHALIDDFAKNWSSQRHPTANDRKKAVLTTLKYGGDNGFSCTYMLDVLTDKPCSGCKLKQAQMKALASTGQVKAQAAGYQRASEDDDGVFLSNFTLKPLKMYLDINAKPNDFSAFDYAVYQMNQNNEVVETSQIKLTHKAFLTALEFRKQISRARDLIWIGSDNDLQFLKSALTNSTIITSEFDTVREVQSVGIHKLVDERPGREIEEYVWVEEGYSVTASGLKDVLVFNGVPNAYGSSRTVKMRAVEAYSGLDEEVNNVIRATFKINLFHVLVPILGWVFSCWLRKHIRRGETTDKHIPILQMCGSAGEGKTETATLLSTLAGANYCSTEPVSVSTTTPFGLRVESSISTTVPRILDEMNEHKIPDRAKYRAAVEVVKCAARGTAMGRGQVGENGLEMNTSMATSPLIMIATQINREQEITDRTITVSLAKLHRNEEHAHNFRVAKDGVEHLKQVAKLAMRETLKLPEEWVDDAILRNIEALPPKLRNDRTARNWEIVLVGLDYMYYVFSKAEKTPVDIMESIRDMRLGLIEWLFDNEQLLITKSEVQEIDMIIEAFGTMVAIDASTNIGRRNYEDGRNYIVAGDTLHIHSTVFFTQYQSYMRNHVGRAPELSSIVQYINLLKGRPYYLGQGLVKGVQAPNGWHSFSIPKLAEKGVNVENFSMKP